MLYILLYEPNVDYVWSSCDIKVPSGQNKTEEQVDDQGKAVQEGGQDDNENDDDDDMISPMEFCDAKLTEDDLNAEEEEDSDTYDYCDPNMFCETSMAEDNDDEVNGILLYSFWCLK